ncbi:antibiotic biosynthesis monooxygenase [Halarcobacter sp.]|uniref:antibiotic biosynthesis monooxygenase family protein n=1 Tax=Halarcobacter sp. TaxID=2321133 RepID=UPI0029F49F61|nr:antibiotic biosynthesis monooxygenase [Halarcobacter sp.]
MIRVIYKWRVEKEDFDAFKEAWSIATNKIHETTKGARGSFMIKSFEDETLISTVARWDNLEQWKAFWTIKPPKEMEKMRKIAEFISSEAYEEIEDYTF